MKLLIVSAVLVLSGCANITPEQMFEAVKIRDDQCGTAQIQGNMDVGGTLGFFGTTVAVNIEKEKRTYTDSAGTLQDCE